MLIESNILPQLMSQGVPIPPEIADFFPIPNEAASQLKEALQKVYDLQLLSLDMQKMQLMSQLQPQPGVPGAAPGGPETPPPGGPSALGPPGGADLSIQ